MKKFLLLLALSAGSFISQAQFPAESKDTTWKTIFRETPARVNNLVHTKLDVRFDYDKSWMYGKEWLTLQPHFYPTDSLRLDAKGMEIKEVALVKGTSKSPLQYKYDGMQLNIKLDKTYTRDEKYTLYFDYTSKPNELKTEGSAAITDAKGLYFINPKGEEKDKPTQIWTQGETEASSVWFITIDRPNQKTTQEINMTVPAKYVTLSNGLLSTQKKNTDGTRTDTWKMSQPHAPYLFFMGVGEYSVVKDLYKGKEVSYYVEKEYEPYARGIFGNTPEMMKFFEEKLGVAYPWDKYAQIVGRDYVSGAMENTTATLHQASAYQNGRELVDGNAWEETIAHELFHHWFGDLVTAESWSQLTVNESFANYSEYLWNEYKYGKDAADAHHYQDMQGYLMSGSDKKNLVRYHYNNKEDMFDAVSYNKGGRILHMLRNYVGDDAFYAALKHYLNANRFKTGEAAQLRLSFEEVTGKDLNWFFNQWYYGSGHPKLKINYSYDDAAGKAMVIVEQTQTGRDFFLLPVAVDVHNGEAKTRHNLWIDARIDTLVFEYTKRPTLINFDADRVLLAEKTDNRSEAEYIQLWKHGKTYLARREAIDFFAKNTMPEIALGLTDKFAGIRRYTLGKIANTPYKDDANALETIEGMARKDRDAKTRAAAISYLVKDGDKKYVDVYRANIADSSYSVAGAALKGIAKSEPSQAYQLAKKYSNDARGALGDAVSNILINEGTEADFPMISKFFKESPLTEEKMKNMSTYAAFVAKLDNIDNVKKGVDDIFAARNQIPSQYHQFVDPMFKQALDKIVNAKGSEIRDYVEKGFK